MAFGDLSGHPPPDCDAVSAGIIFIPSLRSGVVGLPFMTIPRSRSRPTNRANTTQAAAFNFDLKGDFIHGKRTGKKQSRGPEAEEGQAGSEGGKHIRQPDEDGNQNCPAGQCSKEIEPLIEPPLSPSLRATAQVIARPVGHAGVTSAPIDMFSKKELLQP
ncbi:hypothetical protein ACOJBO_39800 [Rhizobium beringeri]